jgi:sulfotransferase 6B1
LVDEGTIALLPLELQLERLAQMRRGMVLDTHNLREPQIERAIEENNIKVIFIYRDPRDVCVSLFHYTKREPRHPRHGFYATLPDDFQRLMVTITGLEGSPEDGRSAMPSMDTRIRQMLTWLTYPHACAVTFEELVGPLGGGTKEKQVDAIARIATHLGVNLSEWSIEMVADRVFSTNTATFRRGQIGGWHHEMTPEHQRAFDQVAGPLLIELGYETDRSWPD